ncbi:MAG: BspA family leucine-rich repeat surface protein [Clostridium sp.]|nr:BspA family leucine-rich repeat surface protein [Clostridium sp.]
MKKVLVGILSILFIVNVEAATSSVTYNQALLGSNTFFNRFTNVENYLSLKDNKFVYKNGKVSSSSDFTSGGLLNEDEFKIGKDYLYNGLDFWIISNTSGKYSIIDPKYKNNSYINDTLSQTSKSGMRYTAFVNNEKIVSGNGSRLEPWEFTSKQPKETNKCTYNGELVKGATFVNGQYTYKYKQEYDMYTIDYENGHQSTDYKWLDMSDDGWGVILTDPSSTDPVVTKLCTTINDKPVVSLSFMFKYSKATKIDLSSFNTKYIKNMSGMFWWSNADTIDISGFDTSNVTNMRYLFANSKIAKIIGLDKINTSNVTNMSAMFNVSSAKSLDLSNFNTSNVTDMSGMFFGSAVTELDVSSFDTRKVTDMSTMFNACKATKYIGLEKFKTSNVTKMPYMFGYCLAKDLNLNSFDTRKVTDMSGMFASSSIESLDLSNFNTSNVTDMNLMFFGSKMPIIDLSSFDTNDNTKMGSMFYNSSATVGYAKTESDAKRFNASAGKPDGLTFKTK